MGNRINVVQYDAGLQKLASSFHSGNEYLDQFLRQGDSLNKDFGKTYVFLSENNRCIIGYYNLGLGYIEEINYGLRRKIGGAVHINCFALDQKYHGLLQTVTAQGIRINLSDILMADCMERIEEIRHNYVGFFFVTLNSTKEGYSLYVRNGFEKLDDDMHFSAKESDVECIPMYFAFGLEEI